MAEEKNISQSVDPEARALIERYPKVYSERKFWKKLWRGAKRAGRVVIQHALTLYYCAQDRDTPRWVRTLIWGALGYFIWPVDTHPDVLPGGYLDDLGVLCSCSVTSLNTSNPSTTNGRVSA